jgi:hypothetical protein
MNAWTAVELMVAVIARTLEDRRVFAQGIATPMAAAAYLLARLTHAPHSVISYTVGNSLGLAVGALSLTRYEDLTLGRALMRWSFPSVVTELLPSLPVTEWFRPAQVDAYGNFNNVVTHCADGGCRRIASPCRVTPGNCLGVSGRILS